MYWGSPFSSPYDATPRTSGATSRHIRQPPNETGRALAYMCMETGMPTRPIRGLASRDLRQSTRIQSMNKLCSIPALFDVILATNGANWRSGVSKQVICLLVAQFVASQERSQARHTRIQDELHGNVTNCKTSTSWQVQKTKSHVAPRSISLADTWQCIKIATHCIKIATH